MYGVLLIAGCLGNGPDLTEIQKPATWTLAFVPSQRYPARTAELPAAVDTDACNSGCHCTYSVVDEGEGYPGAAVQIGASFHESCPATTLSCGVEFSDNDSATGPCSETPTSGPPVVTQYQLTLTRQ
jgi:hypothetical protein